MSLTQTQPSDREKKTKGITDHRQLDQFMSRGLGGYDRVRVMM